MDMKSKHKGSMTILTPKGRRGANGAIALFVPAKVIEEQVPNPSSGMERLLIEMSLLQEDDFSIVQTVSSRSTVG